MRNDIVQVGRWSDTGYVKGSFLSCHVDLAAIEGLRAYCEHVDT